MKVSVRMRENRSNDMKVNGEVHGMTDLVKEKKMKGTKTITKDIEQIH